MRFNMGNLIFKDSNPLTLQIQGQGLIDSVWKKCVKEETPMKMSDMSVHFTRLIGNYASSILFSLSMAK